MKVPTMLTKEEFSTRVDHANEELERLGWEVRWRCGSYDHEAGLVRCEDELWCQVMIWQNPKTRFFGACYHAGDGNDYEIGTADTLEGVMELVYVDQVCCRLDRD